MINYKKAYIAGGCFWGMEDLFRLRPGIVDTEVGYLGGENDNPTYSNHPGHAEGIELSYNPALTSFKEILDFFFRMHNPTTVNQQGNDRGSSYRSAIFFQNNEEKENAEEMIPFMKTALEKSDGEDNAASASAKSSEKKDVKKEDAHQNKRGKVRKKWV